MTYARFEWDKKKNIANQFKHGVSFESAQQAFFDPRAVIIQDVRHGIPEDRFHCMGRVDEGILTVRFTHRGNAIRIFGAGFWRKGKRIYEEANKIHR
ncbi:MAG: BrnT family toxin [Candidatus Krumholzibacteriia bacterium]